MIGLIVAALAITTMTEPKRTAISEEADNDNNEVSKPRSAVQNTTTPTESSEKNTIWKVLFQPKILILCIAASIRHTGTNW
jgi:short subunit fatty acids transporter